MLTRPNDDLNTHGSCIPLVHRPIIFQFMIDILSSKLDALTRIAAPLLLTGLGHVRPAVTSCE